MVPIRQEAIVWGEHFYSLVRPEQPDRLSTSGIQAHQIVPSELEGASPLSEILEQIDQRLQRDVLLLHYGSVDLGFLQRAYKRLGKPWLKPITVDTAVLLTKLTHRAQQFDPHSPALPLGLSKARAYFGLPAHLEHHALYDALATAELFLQLRSRLGAKTLKSLM